MATTTEVFGHPTDDLTVDLIRKVTSPVNGATSAPWMLIFPGGGFRNLFMGPGLQQCVLDCTKKGYFAAVIFYRTDDPANYLPNQTHPAVWPLQTNDCKMAVRAARADARCNGQVGVIGGSSGGTHATSLGIEHENNPGVWTPADRANVVISMSGCYNFGDRTPVDYEPLTQFISDVNLYTGTTNTATQTANSPVSFLAAGQIAKIYMSHTQQDPMPFTQQTLMVAALQALGFAGFVDKVLGGSAHSFAQWTTISGEATDFIANALGGGGPGALPPQITAFTPDNGKPGDVVTITGFNFIGVTDVSFGGVDAVGFTNLTPGQVTAIVAPNTITGLIRVTTPAGVGNSSTAFNFNRPGDLPSARSPILNYPKGGLPPAVLVPAPPSPPFNLSAVPPNPTSHNIALGWTPPLQPHGSLLPYVLSVSGGPATVDIIPGDSTGTLLTNLAPGAQYTAHLQAQNIFGLSDFNAPESILTFRTGLGIPPDHVKAEPRGLYRLLSSGGTGIPDLELTGPWWSNPRVTGSRFRTNWSVIQPTSPAVPGVDPATTYDWSLIDTYLDQCAATGKTAGISIACGIFSPSWLFQLPGMAAFQEHGPDAGLMPLPWNSTYIQYHAAMIQAFADRYDNRTELQYVVMSGLGQVVETYVCQAGDVAALTALAVAQGFATIVDAWLFAAGQLISIYDVAFQKTNVCISLALPVPNSTPGRTGDDGVSALVGGLMVGNYTATANFGLMNAGLNGGSSFNFIPNQAISTLSKNFAAGFQFGHASNNPDCDPTQPPASYNALTGFTNATNAGVALNTKFLELYRTDMDSTDAGYTAQMDATIAAMAAKPSRTPPIT